MPCCFGQPAGFVLAKVLTTFSFFSFCSFCPKQQNRWNGINYCSHNSGMETGKEKVCQKAISSILVPERFPKTAL